MENNSLKNLEIDLQEIKDSANQSETNLQNKLNKLLIDNSTTVIKPPSILSSYNSNNELISIGSESGIMTIIGKAKSRKSYYLSILTATTLTKKPILSTYKNDIKGDNYKVLYFDTEQSKYHVTKAYQRICEIASTEKLDNLKMHQLRSLKPEKRLELIEYAIENTQNLKVVIIDGIRDIVTSINDEDQATNISSKLLKWSDEKQILIIVVLHQNKGDNNARGHLGTELVNKSDTVLSVTKSEKDKNISIVEPQQCRNKEPEIFAFEINEDGLPIKVENYQIRTSTKKENIQLYDLDYNTQSDILKTVFINKSDGIKYGNLVSLIKIQLKDKLGSHYGDNKIKDFISFCKENEYLTQNENRSPLKLNTDKFN